VYVMATHVSRTHVSLQASIIMVERKGSLPGIQALGFRLGRCMGCMVLWSNDLYLLQSWVHTSQTGILPLYMGII
jgi:hypothetical protein